MKNRTLSLFYTALLLAVLSFKTFACACCADPGTYLLAKSPLDDYEREMLSSMRYAPTTALYLDEAGFEMISGLSGWDAAFDRSETGSEFRSVAIKGGLASGIWKWNLALGPMNGAISLPLPKENEYYAVDIHDGKSSPGGGPLLYKELRFRGKVGGGTGFFTNGLNGGADYFLVFQGRGNGCNNVEDFTHWRLSVNGPGARYSFFGELASGKPRK